MLGYSIEKLLAPTINYYESNESNYFPDIYQMTEKTTNFENIFNEMKVNTKTKFSLKTCSNPNCVNPFSGNSNCNECHSCGAKYCGNCIKKCQKCDEYICCFCVTIKYDKYEDVELCPNCANNQEI